MFQNQLGPPQHNDAEAEANYASFLEHSEKVLAANRKAEAEAKARVSDPHYDQKQVAERFKDYQGRTYTPEQIREIGVKDQAVALKIVEAGLMDGGV